MGLIITEKCWDTYKEKYGEEFTYEHKKNSWNNKINNDYSINPKLIKLVEEIGVKECSGLATTLEIQLIPEALKDYIEVIYDKGIKIVSINYDKAFANILHKEKPSYEKYTYNKGQQLLDIYNQYYRIAHVKENLDEIMDELTTKNYVKVYDKKIFTIKE
jgi:hypothetical protein